MTRTSQRPGPRQLSMSPAMSTLVTVISSRWPAGTRGAAVAVRKASRSAMRLRASVSRETQLRRRSVYFSGWAKVTVTGASAAHAAAEVRVTRSEASEASRAICRISARLRGDLDERGWLGLDLDGGVIDAESGVEDDVQGVQDLVGGRTDLDHHVDAHG